VGKEGISPYAGLPAEARNYNKWVGRRVNMGPKDLNVREQIPRTAKNRKGTRRWATKNFSGCVEKKVTNKNCLNAETPKKNNGEKAAMFIVGGLGTANG